MEVDPIGLGVGNGVGNGNGDGIDFDGIDFDDLRGDLEAMSGEGCLEGEGGCVGTQGK